MNRGRPGDEARASFSPVVCLGSRSFISGIFGAARAPLATFTLLSRVRWSSSSHSWYSLMVLRPGASAFKRFCKILTSPRPLITNSAFVFGFLVLFYVLLVLTSSPIAPTSCGSEPIYLMPTSTCSIYLEAGNLAVPEVLEADSDNIV